MTARKPASKSADVIDMNAVVATASKPSVPLILESSMQTMAWSRDLHAIEGEIEVLDAQVESARRIRETIRTEAQAVFDAKVAAADKVQAKANEDGDKVLAATTEMASRRRSDLERVRDSIRAAQASLMATAAE